MANRIRNEPDETTELKRLLFSPELELLDRVRDRTAVLHSRVGADPALIDSIRRVLVDVLRQSGVHDHDRVAAALAPLVLDTVRREIRNSRDAMLESLYPVAGKLVQAAIAQAMRQLADSMAKPVDSVFSPSLWSARFSAWGSGRKVGDVLLARSNTFVVERVLLIHRPTGLLVGDSGAKDLVSDDSEQLAALLSVVQTFARDAFSRRTDGFVRGITFSDREVHIAGSVMSLLAVKTRGRAPDDLEERLQAALMDVSSRWADPIQDFAGALPAGERAELQADLTIANEQISGNAAGEAPKRKPTTGLIILGLIALGLVGWFAYSAFQGWRDGKVEDKAVALIDAPEWRGYPMSFDYEGGDRTLAASGLAPNATAAARLQSGLQQIDRVGNVVFNVTPMSGQPGTASQPSESALSARIAALEKQGSGGGVDPVSRIALWLAQHPIQFNERNSFADRRTAEQRLDAVAQLIKAWDLNFKVLVTGYADPNERRPRRASTGRAELVAAALTGRGVPSDRLIVLGRSGEAPVAPPGDATNRRVAFEIAWR